jgi:hypothetical protein
MVCRILPPAWGPTGGSGPILLLGVGAGDRVGGRDGRGGRRSPLCAHRLRLFSVPHGFCAWSGVAGALACALSASPSLLRSGMTNLRLSMPPRWWLQLRPSLEPAWDWPCRPTLYRPALGVVILMVVLIMAVARKSDFPVVQKPDALSARLRMHGVYHEISLGRDIHWQIHRAGVGLCLFAVIGFLAGLFGLGAGWANVPVLNLVMGRPSRWPQAPACSSCPSSIRPPRGCICTRGPFYR